MWPMGLLLSVLKWDSQALYTRQSTSSQPLMGESDTWFTHQLCQSPRILLLFYEVRSTHARFGVNLQQLLVFFSTNSFSHSTFQVLTDILVTGSFVLRNQLSICTKEIHYLLINNIILLLSQF